jgi:hypothetical protein
MALETIFQNEIISNFILPFLLMFLVVFAILEKTKLLGENKQVNSLLSLVIGLVFVGAIFPKLVVENLVLFLTVAIVIMFVGLMLWGFVMGEGGIKIFDNTGPGLKWLIGVIILIAVIIAVLWATGVGPESMDFLFGQSWSNALWTNVAFIVVIALALAVAWKTSSAAS